MGGKRGRKRNEYQDKKECGRKLRNIVINLVMGAISKEQQAIANDVDKLIIERKG
jgi:hypothetical protein